MYFFNQKMKKNQNDNPRPFQGNQRKVKQIYPSVSIQQTGKDPINDDKAGLATDEQTFSFTTVSTDWCQGQGKSSPSKC